MKQIQLRFAINGKVCVEIIVKNLEFCGQGS